MPSNYRRAKPGRALTIIGLGRAVELAVRDAGLTSARFRALSLVAADISSSGLIARFLDVTPPTVTSVMDGLVNDGLVERHPGEVDRRRVDYSLTPRGSSALDAANAAASAALTSLAETLSPTERGEAFEGLDRWTSAIDDRRRSHWGAQ